MTKVSRRRLMTATATFSGSMVMRNRCLWATESEARSDFTRSLEGWETVTGTWGIEVVPGASRGKALVQRATNNAFNAIVAPGGPYTGVDVSVRFKPISGRKDASGGIVFRFTEGRYYVIRANALEDNFNLYYNDGGRHQITGARVEAPALGLWHKLHINAEGDHIKGWLNDQLLIDHRDSRLTSGRVGLWTKADSITAFDDLVIGPADRG